MSELNLGFLNFGIGGDDSELKQIFETLNKDADSLQEKLKNIQVKSVPDGNMESMFQEQLKKAEKTSKDMAAALKDALAKLADVQKKGSKDAADSVVEDLNKIASIDLSANIEFLFDRMTKLRVEFDSLMRMAETSGEAGTFDMFLMEAEAASKEIESLTRQIQAMERAQQTLSQSNNNFIPSRAMKDDRELSMMADYYRELEKSSAAHAVAQKKAMAEEMKAAKLREAQAKKRTADAGREAKKRTASERKEAAEQAAIQKKLAAEAVALEKQKEIAYRAAMANLKAQQQSLFGSMQVTNKTMFNQKQLISQLTSSLGMYFSIYKVASFVREMANVSGEFEKQRLSLGAILQDVDGADKIFSQIKELAVKSPFSFADLTSYAKQLSAFSIPTNELYDTMTKLADVSAGLGVDMNRIILAYGQVRSAAVLRGQELRQFTEAGIPLVQLLANKFSEMNGQLVSTGEIFDKISRRQVSFDMVADIFSDMTAEGGKFHQMQEVQASSLAGMIKNLRDAMDVMYDEIGSANSGLLKDSVKTMVVMMNNWRTMGSALAGLIATYGVYKTVMGVVILRRKIMNLANAAEVAGKLMNVGATKELTKANLMLAGSMKAIGTGNVIGMALAAITAIGYAFYTASQKAGRLNKELAESTAQIKGTADSAVAHLGILMDRLDKASQGSETYRKIIENINAISGDYIENRFTEAMAYGEIKEQIEGVTKALYANAKAKSYNKSLELIQKDASDGFESSYSSFVKSFEKVVHGKGLAASEAKILFEKMRDDDAFANDTKAISDYIQKVARVANAELKSGKWGLFGHDDTMRQLRLATDAAKDYASILTELPLKREDAKDMSDAIWGTTDNFETKADNIREIYEKKQKEINDTLKASSEEVEDTLKALRAEELEALIPVYLADNQMARVIEMKQELAKILGLSDTWQQELGAALFGTLTVQDETGYEEITDQMISEAKRAREKMEAYTDDLERSGYNFEEKVFNAPFVLSKTTKRMADEYEKHASTIEVLRVAFELAGMDIDNLESKSKGGAEPKDTFADAYKEELSVLDKARKAYEDLTKSMSDYDAQAQLSSMELYSGIDMSSLTDDGYGKAIDGLIERYSKNGGTLNDERLKFLRTLKEAQADLILKGVIDDVKDGIDIIEQELDAKLVQFDLYDKLFDLTGDKEKSIRVAFGADVIVESIRQSYIDAFEDAAKISYADYLLKSPEEQKAYTDIEGVGKIEKKIDTLDKQEARAFSDRMLQIITETQSTEEKLTAIKQRGEEERLKIQKEFGASNPEHAADLIKRSQKIQDEAIDELETSLMQLTPAWQKMFADLSDMSKFTLKRLKSDVQEIVDAVDTAVKDSDGKMVRYNDQGDITGYYIKLADEDGIMKTHILTVEQYNKVLKQNESIRTKIIDSDPLLSMVSSIKSKTSQSSKEDSSGLAGVAASINPVLGVIVAIVEEMGDLGEMVSSLSGDFGGLFSAFGNDSAADAMELVGGLGDSLSAIMSGNPVEMIGGIINGIVSIAAHHDKKLDRAIEDSQHRVRLLADAYEQLTRQIERQLGGISEAQMRIMKQNQAKQLKELELQLDKEKDKKKKDKSAQADLEAEIAEAKDKLLYFAEDMAKELWDIDIKGWASQISSAIVDAFASGENAVKSFDRTVDEMMRNLVTQMVNKNLIEKSMGDMREYLFGKNGKGGVLADGDISASDMSGIAKHFKGITTEIENADKMIRELDAIYKAEMGHSMFEGMNDNNTLTKGLQALTENTGDLLASYINAMRADLSETVKMLRMREISDININGSLALQLAVLKQIELNTGRNAETSDAVLRLLKDITVAGGRRVNI